MSRQFKTYNHDQIFLLPPSLKEWFPEDHLVYFVSDVVDQLDLSEIMKTYDRESSRGQPAYHPAMMLKLLFCAGSLGL